MAGQPIDMLVNTGSAVTLLHQHVVDRSPKNFKLSVDCLLGIDFLGKHGCKIDFDAKSLGIGGKIVNLLAKSGGNKVFTISLAETVVVPGCNEMMLHVLDIKKTRTPYHP